MALDIRVRPYRLPEDIEALVRIWEDSEDHHEAIDPDPPLVPRSIEATRRRFEQLQPDAQRALLVAEVDGAVLGLVEATMRRDESNGFAGAYVNELAVAAAWRGRGIGTRLLAEVEQWGRDNGALALALDTLVANAGARRLYERLGFHVRAVVMGKRLPRT